MLVIHPGALGDLAQAVPAIAALRTAVGPGRLALATQRDLAPLAAGLHTAGGPLFDELITFDGAALFGGRVGARARIAAALVARIRAGRYASAVICKAAPAYAALAAAARIPRRVGFARSNGLGARLLRAGLLTRAVPYAAGRHRDDRYQDLVVAAGADPARQAQVAWTSAADEREAAALLAPLRRTEDVVLVGIAPGGARNAKEEMPARRWPADRYAELARRVARLEPAARFVLLGGSGDAAETGAVRAAVPEGHVLDLTGQTTPAGALAVIAGLDAFLCNDSALLHLASCTPTPVVAVFGPSDPREACPRRAGIVALWAPARATPCLDDVTGRLPPCVTPCCIERVDVTAVLHALVGALGRSAISVSAESRVYTLRAVRA